MVHITSVILLDASSFNMKDITSEGVFKIGLYLLSLGISLKSKELLYDTYSIKSSVYKYRRILTMLL